MVKTNEDIMTPGLLDVARPDAARAVTLVLPGGKANSFDVMRGDGLATARMKPFAKRLAKIDGMGVFVARYRYQGWNEGVASPLADARWALEQIQAQYPGSPVVLVGHSMGARVALRCAAQESVAGVVALAPWLPAGEPVSHLSGRTVVMAHGNLDFVTSAAGSLAFARRARAEGAAIGRGKVIGDLHAMLFRAHLWNRLVTGGARLALDLDGVPKVVKKVMDEGWSGNLNASI
jgi:dienelactone hydrolase